MENFKSTPINRKTTAYESEYFGSDDESFKIPNENERTCKQKDDEYEEETFLKRLKTKQELKEKYGDGLLRKAISDLDYFLKEDHEYENNPWKPETPVASKKNTLFKFSQHLRESVFHTKDPIDQFFSKVIAGHTLTPQELSKKKNVFEDFYNKIVIGNEKWVNRKKIENPLYFEELTKPQKPEYLVISCSDSRVVVNEFTSTNAGEIFTHRNVGNMVVSTDINCQSVIQYAVDYLKVNHIMVIGHTDCGAVKASLTSKYHGLIDHWLKNIREVAEKHIEHLDMQNSTHDQVVRKLIELNVREQCLNLCKNPIIQSAWARNEDLLIHGYVFEIDTGYLRLVESLKKDWNEVQNIYKFDL